MQLKDPINSEEEEETKDEGRPYISDATGRLKYHR